MRTQLILMLKYPEPGAVKTRLIPALGKARACDLYRQLVSHTLNEARRYAEKSSVSLSASVANYPSDDAVSQWLAADISFTKQGEGDLGQRMERAVGNAFAAGASRVVVIGADCPELTAGHLDSAFRALEAKDVVIGPAADGGYYLIGMRQFLPELFRGVLWSTDQVLEQTLATVRFMGTECQLLEALHDLDRPEDLFLLERIPAAQAAGRGKFSIVIPTLNEAQNLQRTIESARLGDPHEIIVVDGGSSDDTKIIARELDAIVLTTSACRATQMNQGAAIATGEYIMFLHADTLLPCGYASHVFTVLSQPGVAGGAFALAITGEFTGRRLVERASNWRSRRRQLPYGDQALFLHHKTFQQLGGFREMPIMEDYEFVHRLRQHGQIVLAPTTVHTSGRRWQRLGFLRTTLLNQIIILAYHCGVPPEVLAEWYRGSKHQVQSFNLQPRAEPEPKQSCA